MFHVWLRIEVDAVRYPNEHVAVSNPVVLGHAHADTVASWVDHGLEVTGRIDPVVDGVLGGISRTGEHGEVGPETVGVAGVDSGLAFLRGVMPSVAPAGTGLGGVHQGLTDRQFRYTVGPAGLVDQPDHLLSYLHVACQAGVAILNRRGGGGGANREHHGSVLSGIVGDSNLRGSLRLGNSNPEGEYLFYRYNVWVAGSDGVLCPAGADDQATSLSHPQGAAFVAAYPDGWGLRCDSRDSEDDCKDGCCQCSDALFPVGHSFPPVFSIFCVFGNQHNTE